MKKVSRIRRLKYGSNSLVLIVSIIGIVLLLNVLLYGFHFRVDMTKSNIHTLSDQTKQVLKSIDREVEIVGFFKEDSTILPQIADLLKEYDNESEDIVYSLVDMDASPLKAKEYGVTEYGTVVLRSGDKTIQIRKNDFYQLDFRTTKQAFAGEEAITQGIIDVTSEKQNKAYIIEGHGELTRDNLYWFKNAINGEGYQVDFLNIAQENGIPDDTDLLIIPGPKKDYSSDELWALTKYSDNGGRILFLMGYVKDKDSIKNLNMYIRSLGVEVSNDVIVDPTSNAFNDPLTIIPNYEIHPITNKLKENGLITVMPGTTSISKSDEIGKNTKFESLLVTSSKSWGETQISSGDIDLDESDNKGPLTVAAAITKPGREQEMKVVVIGNSVIAANEIINEQGNMDLLINSINYIQDKENLISIRPKHRVMEPITIKGNQATMLYVILVALIPSLLVIISLVIFIRRRRR